MTLEQLEIKVHSLERQLNDIQRMLRPLGALPSIEETFGMFADDPDFDEVVRLGREYREKANRESVE
jgi:hypothetical protein